MLSTTHGCFAFVAAAKHTTGLVAPGHHDGSHRRRSPPKGARQRQMAPDADRDEYAQVVRWVAERYDGGCPFESRPNRALHITSIVYLRKTPRRPPLVLP